MANLTVFLLCLVVLSVKGYTTTTRNYLWETTTPTTTSTTTHRSTPSTTTSTTRPSTTTRTTTPDWLHRTTTNPWLIYQQSTTPYYNPYTTPYHPDWYNWYTTPDYYNTPNYYNPYTTPYRPDWYNWDTTPDYYNTPNYYNPYTTPYRPDWYNWYTTPDYENTPGPYDYTTPHYNYHTTDGRPQPLRNYIHLSVEPSASTGMTVTCRLDAIPTQGTDVESVVSMVIKRVQMPQREIKNVATITAFHPDTPRLDTAIHGAEVKGAFYDDSRYLSVTWNFPSTGELTDYMCETHFLNNFGDTDVVTVYAKTPTSIVVDNNMTRTELMLELSTAIFENQKLREANRNLTEDKLTLLLYIFREPVHGHFSGGLSSYYMSKFQSPSDQEAAEVCRSGLGGYLLEINSLEEYLMIQNYVNTETKPGDTVLTGANDKALENKWINGHSNMAVTYFDWGPDQPHGGLAKNCLALWHSETDGTKMADIPCATNPEAYTTYFICEKDAIVR